MDSCNGASERASQLTLTEPVRGDMYKGLIVVVAVATMSVYTAGQDAHRFEVFGGYSLERVAPCGTAFGQCISEGSVPTTTFNGWNASLTGYLYKFLGITADFSGHYAYVPVAADSAHRHSYLFGPVFAYRSGKVSPFAHALFGEISQASSTQVIRMDYTSFMWAIGGGLDVSLRRRLSVRPLQFDYEKHSVASFTSGATTEGLRYSAGVVWKF